MEKLKQDNKKLEKIASFNLLKPICIACMSFGFVLGWVCSRVILVILFYLIFTPLSLFMRLLSIDLLELKKKKDTYWKKKEKVVLKPVYYERRF